MTGPPEIIHYSPSEYSPTYELEIDDQCDFVRLVRVLSHEYPGAAEHPLGDHYVKYIQTAWPTSWLRTAMRHNRGIK